MADNLSALTTPQSKDELKGTFDKVKDLSRVIDEMVEDVVQFVCEELDNYMLGISDILTNQETPVTDLQLDDFTLNLPSLLYFVSAQQETLGIKEDVSKALQKEVFNRVREKAQGTVADKDTAAELAAQHETVVNIIYARAYKKVKLRIDAAWEMLNSVKKVTTRRIAEYGLTQSDDARGRT